MQSQLEERPLVGRGVISESSFGISQNAVDQAHLSVILRDKLYDDKILAVIREYSTNAVDAHIEAGIPETPISVKLPTRWEPQLVIRDFGPGLSEEQVYNIFGMYGASTKRDTNQQVGQYGIGCKAGLAYCSQYMVTSHHNGKASVYSAALDGHMGKLSKLSEEDSDSTGIEISIPVEVDDIDAFKVRARLLFQWFDVTPDCNIDIPSRPECFPSGHIKPKRKLEYWETDNQTNEWYAVMGGVPYLIRFDKPGWADKWHEAMVEHDVENLMEVSGFVLFDIGDITIPPAREEIEYSEANIQAVAQKLASLQTEATEELTKSLDSIKKGYLRRKEALRWMETTGLKPPKYADVAIPLWTASLEPRQGPTQLSNGIPIDLGKILAHEQTIVTFNGGRIPSVQVWKNIYTYEDEYILIVDDKRNFRYFGAYGKYIKLEIAKGHTVDEAKAEVERLLKQAELDGLPIKLLSEFPYNEPQRRSFSNHGAPDKKKYNKQLFVYNGGRETRPKSNNWDPVDPDHEPKHDDVFVILDSFVPRSARTNDLSSKITAIETITGKTGVKLYGYRHTASNPVDENDIVGVEITDYLTKVATRAAFRTLSTGALAAATISYAHEGALAAATISYAHEVHEGYIGNLPSSHPVSKLAVDNSASNNMTSQQIAAAKNMDPTMYAVLKASWAERVNALRDNYPLARLNSFSPSYAEYIKAIDFYRKNKENQ